jgi:hypothetical protein
MPTVRKRRWAMEVDVPRRPHAAQQLYLTRAHRDEGLTNRALRNTVDAYFGCDKATRRVWCLRWESRKGKVSSFVAAEPNRFERIRGRPPAGGDQPSAVGRIALEIVSESKFIGNLRPRSGLGNKWEETSPEKIDEVIRGCIHQIAEDAFFSGNKIAIHINIFFREW